MVPSGSHDGETHLLGWLMCICDKDVTESGGHGRASMGPFDEVVFIFVDGMQKPASSRKLTRWLVA